MENPLFMSHKFPTSRELRDCDEYIDFTMSAHDFMKRGMVLTYVNEKFDGLHFERGGVPYSVVLKDGVWCAKKVGAVKLLS